MEDIDTNLCTHAIFGFAGIENNTIKVLYHQNSIEKGAYKRFVALKNKNPNLRTLIAIGGWSQGSKNFSRMASSNETRKTFIRSVLGFLDQFKFDGVDIDWEYPANRGGKPEDKDNFSSLLRELKAALQQKKYILTIAVSSSKKIIDSAYAVEAISESVDFINLMTYNFNGPWKNKTGINTPMSAGPNASRAETERTIEYSVNYWIAKGAPKEKLVMGMHFNGHTFTLQDPCQNSIGSPTVGPGNAGPYSKQKGSLGFNVICEMLEHGWTVRRDPVSKTPFAYKGDQWVSFDDLESIRIKARFVKQMDLAGAMVWSIDSDDSKGRCGNGNFPLLKAINMSMNDS